MPSRSAASRIVSPARTGTMRLSGRSSMCWPPPARLGGSHGSTSMTSVSPPAIAHASLGPAASTSG
jgi:hypothetical protein